MKRSRAARAGCCERRASSAGEPELPADRAPARLRSSRALPLGARRAAPARSRGARRASRGRARPRATSAASCASSARRAVDRRRAPGAACSRADEQADARHDQRQQRAHLRACDPPEQGRDRTTVRRQFRAMTRPDFRQVSRSFSDGIGCLCPNRLLTSPPRDVPAPTGAPVLVSGSERRSRRGLAPYVLLGSLRGASRRPPRRARSTRPRDRGQAGRGAAGARRRSTS